MLIQFSENEQSKVLLCFNSVCITHYFFKTIRLNNYANEIPVQRSSSMVACAGDCCRYFFQHRPSATLFYQKENQSSMLTFSFYCHCRRTCTVCFARRISFRQRYAANRRNRRKGSEECTADSCIATGY